MKEKHVNLIQPFSRLLQFIIFNNLIHNFTFFSKVIQEESNLFED